jgi:hypothetical protein
VQIPPPGERSYALPGGSQTYQSGNNPNQGTLGVIVKHEEHLTSPRLTSIRKYHRLQAGNFEAFAAADVFAGHHVVFAQHVGTGFGEAGAVALVGAAGELLLLGTDDPSDFILGGLTAMRTVQVRHLLFGTFVEKFSFFHKGVVGRRLLVVGLNLIIAVLLHSSYGKILEMAPKKKKIKKFSAVQAVKEMSRDRIGMLPVARVVPDRKKKLEDSKKHKPTLGKLLEGTE